MKIRIGLLFYLIVDLTDHYNVSAPTSSLAQPDELVQAAAVFRTTGC